MSRLVTLLVLTAATVAHADELPRSLDSRIKIELFAEHPQLRTPTGIDVDHQGRVWVIESNTHFRPEEYDGHPSDRLLIMTDTDGDGRADDVKTFADGFTHAMSIAVRPVWMEEVKVEGQSSSDDGNSGNPSTLDPRPSTQIFLATRREILLLEDTDGDDQCDRQTVLVRLETEGNYPHNGLAGFAFDALGWMYFGFGENLGEPYRLESREMSVESSESENTPQNPSTLNSHPSTLSGGGEGGNLYRMRPDGTQLSYWATGFWNPHASCVDAFGRLFTVDNDPDSLPPCRLLHIIEGGDYGYRFRNGRKGQHPFTAWNGEIPGTLPMVAGTGEAPSGILAYEHDAFPEEYLGNLIVTSWGDHRIDRFVLKPKGASFESIAEPLIQGGENFRPVGIALAPDGSLYCSDWVLRDYNLHGQGRVWRIAAVDPSDSSSSLVERRSASWQLSHTAEGREVLLERLQNSEALVRDRIESLWSLALVPQEEAQFNLLVSEGSPTGILARADEVSLAALDLIGTPHMRFPNPPPNGLGVRANQEVSVSAIIVIVRLTEHYLKTHNLAGVAWLGALRHDDPFLRHIVRNEILDHGDLEAVVKFIDDERTASNGVGNLPVASLLIARRAFPEDQAIVIRGLRHRDQAVQRLAVQWAAEEGMTELRPQVEAVLHSEPMTTDLFLAALAALEMLDGKDPKDFDQTPAGKYVLPLLTDAEAPASVKVQALRLVEPTDPGLSADSLRRLLESDDVTLRLEAVRTLQFSTLEETGAILASLALDREEDLTLRAEAVLGLGRVTQGMPADDPTRIALRTLLDEAPQPLRNEAMRSLRGVGADDEATREKLLDWGEKLIVVAAVNATAREWADQVAMALGGDPHEWPELVRTYRTPPSDNGADWKELLLAENSGEAESGRRVFFHPNGPACSKCHTVNGRGGNIGPDLSNIGRSSSREKLIDSILDPSKEVAPQFTTWNMLSADGVAHSGMIVHENKGKTVLGNADGKLVELETIDIDLRTPLRTSVMPEKLEDRMTVREFRDLLEFLNSLGR